MAKRVIAVCLSLGALFAIGAGCSSIPDHRTVLSNNPDGGGETPDGGATGGVNGGGGSGGSGGVKPGTGGNGNGGKAGATSTGGTGAGGRTMSVDGGDASVPGIPCGTNHCAGRTLGRTEYPACCAGAGKDQCGLDTTVNSGPGCVAPDQAGALDTVCKDLTTEDGNSTYAGCCRPDSKCGVVFDLPGGPHFGCVDPTDLGLAAGKDCTPAVCTAGGKDCKTNSECCPGAGGDPVCATFTSTGTATCSDYCSSNADCASGCCILLISGRGACAPDATSCSEMCRKADETCDQDSDCCAPDVCAPNSDFGPRLCRPKCTTNATCTPEFCVKDEAGRGSCSTSGGGLCTDTCKLAMDGSCEDGATPQDYSDCALGSDCTDCGGASKTARLGGTTFCFDTCTTHTNKKCEDGGTGAQAASCDFGSDCTDCGPRLGICDNSCGYTANDGYCDDGGTDAFDSNCAFGTDCADCGVRFGGRGQGKCDGSTGYRCTPNGGVLDDLSIEDGTCQCPDCAWDAVDCKTPASLCDGKTLGVCCAPNNPCHIQFDGICACGGWCDWETPDCGPTFPPTLCDGTITGCTYTNYNKAFLGNNTCNCKGACSWEQAECASLGELCADTCKSANDGTCDDDDVKCPYGTDCADCGARFPK
ncbi:MAG TPA: hypothetical protein VH062_36090 [Polyangiaceae bacterium]|jgi:hypothetical protein|nr:hypothetical protein [Polyangiaceae bacterium]